MAKAEQVLCHKLNRVTMAPMLKSLRAVVRFKKFEPDPVKRRLSKVANIEDLRHLARRRLPSGVFDYIDGAAEDERTYSRNEAGFAKIGFAPRVLRGNAEIDTSTTLMGKHLPVPLVLAPTGFTRIAHSQGELAVARSAARAGLPYALSTLGTRSIEEVAEAGDGDKWFQVYVWKDRGLVDEMLDRAATAGYSTAVVTVDTATFGRRERDVRRGFTLPPRIGLGTIIDGIRRPGWSLDFVKAEPIMFANVTGGSVGDGSDPVSLAEYVADQMDPGLSWEDIDHFREQWPGKMTIKGIQTVADAKIAVDHGVDAVILSNHGGRQLDDAPAPIDLLPSVADALGGHTDIILDGGIRRGSDVVKAVSLGAKACMFGRAYLYGLGAAGEQGVDFVLEHLVEGVERTLSLIGCRSLDALGPEYLADYQ